MRVEALKGMRSKRGGGGPWPKGFMEHMTSHDGDELEAMHALITLYQRVDSVEGMPSGKRRVMETSDDVICHLSGVLVGCWASCLVEGMPLGESRSTRRHVKRERGGGHLAKGIHGAYDKS